MSNQEQWERNLDSVAFGLLLFDDPSRPLAPTLCALDATPTTQVQQWETSLHLAPWVSLAISGSSTATPPGGKFARCVSSRRPPVVGVVSFAASPGLVDRGYGGYPLRSWGSYAAPHQRRTLRGHQPEVGSSRQRLARASDTAKWRVWLAVPATAVVVVVIPTIAQAVTPERGHI
jgi:hypothetical protein